MDLSLFKVLSLSPFDRCRVVAGASGLSKTITSINVVDCPDPGPWVSKGQLVFTTGYVFKDDPSEQVRLIRRLTEQGCCGMAIKFSRFLPDPPKEMLREADLLEFPLIDIPCDLSLSELMASLMGGILEYRHYQNRQEEIVGFISALLSGELCERDRILAEGRFIGLQPNCCYVGLCAILESSEGLQASAIRGTLENMLSKAGYLAGVNVIAATVKNEVIALLQCYRRKEEAKLPWHAVAALVLEKMELAFPGEKISIGIGNPVQDVTKISASCREARQAVLAGNRMAQPREEPIFLYESLWPYILLQSLPEAECCKYADTILRPLEQADRKNNSELIQTLECYLFFNGRSADCAKALYVHRNTINFRLSRIEQLLGISLKDGETLFRLQLALKLNRLKKGGAALPPFSERTDE